MHRLHCLAKGVWDRDTMLGKLRNTCSRNVFDMPNEDEGGIFRATHAWVNVWNNGQ